jgi:hypothetical protein
MPDQGNHCNICCPAADVDDHVARRLGNGKTCADGRHHGLFHEIDFAGLGAISRVLDGALFHLRNLRGHADDNARMHQHLAVVRLLDKVVEHLLGDFEVGNDAVLHGLDGHDVSGRAAQHVLSLFAHRFYFAGVLVDRHNGGLVDHDALAGCKDQRVGGAEIDGQIARKHAEERAQAVRPRIAGWKTVHGHWEMDLPQAVLYGYWAVAV